MSETLLDGARISYSHLGDKDGEPVVLLHSSACSGGQWRALSDALRDRFQVLAPDLYGYGETDYWCGRERLRLVDEARLVEHVAEQALGRSHGPVHLVGHSYGGAVALKLALRRPERLTSLTLIEPVSFHLLWNSDPGSMSRFGEIRRVADGVTQDLRRGDRETAMLRFVDYWNGPGAWYALSDRKRRELLRVAPKIAADFFAAITEPSELRDLARIAAPTLLLCGGASPAPTRRIFQMLAGAIKASRGLELRGAGHMLPLTHPQPVNAAIARHLEQFARPRRMAA